MSSDLITIMEKPIGQKTVSSVDARELHTTLGARRNFSNWVTQIIESGDWLEHQDFIITNFEVSNSPGAGRPREHFYVFSMEMAEHVAMMTRTARGKEVRNYFRKARDERDALASKAVPQIQPSYIDAYPELKAISTLVLGLAEQRHELDMVKATNAEILAEQMAQKDELIATQQQMLDTRSQSTRAESKADMALDEAHRMTIEEFILINGLIRQFPHSKHAEYSRWLGSFCLDNALDVRKAPVLGKSWDNENAYPIQALGAWYRYEIKRPQQIALVNRPRTGEATP